MKALLRDERVSFTNTAIQGAAAMDMGVPEMLAAVASLTSRHLYKSMTTHADHRVWHDVYHVDTGKGLVYLKLTVFEDLLIVSFKEKDA